MRKRCNVTGDMTRPNVRPHLDLHVTNRCLVVEVRPQAGLDKAWVWWTRDGFWIWLCEAAGRSKWDIVMVERGRRPSQVGHGYS